MIESLIQKLKPQFKGEIANDGITIEKYSRDASLFKINPEVVLFPKDVNDLKLIVAAVNEERAAGNQVYLTPRVSRN
jgi:FAD/FMN-containing dehydrogenase